MIVKPRDDEKPSAGGVAAVERALLVLHVFRDDDGDGALTLAELSRRTGLYKSTLLRLAVSLERQRFLARQEDGRFRLGSALLYLGGIYERGLDLHHLVEPALRSLAEITGESATFQIREGNHRVVILRVEGRHTVREDIAIGMMMPLDRGAPGRVIVQYSGPPDQWPQPKVIVSFGERNPEVAAASAPVFGLRRTLVGALCASGTVSRLSVPARMQMMKEAVRDIARTLTGTLGGDASIFDQMEC